jgi:DNA-binding transcriptional LysR family regulator
MDRFKTMETFVNIVRCGSLSKAARRLSVSRAIVTRHLQQLEEHLGARLFNRTTRQLSLTDIGERYYASCSKLLAEVEEADLAVSRQQNQPRGTLRLIAPPSFGNMRLAPIIADFMVAYPSIHISLTVTSFSVQELDERNFDVAVYPASRLPNIGLTGRKIGEARWLICATPKYLMRHGEPHVPEDLAAHNCLWMRITDPSRYWTFYKGSDKIDVPVSGSLVTNSVASAKAAVMAGVGISLLPEYSLGDDLAAGRIREIMPGYAVASRPIYALYRYSRYIPNKIRVFTDFVDRSLSQDSVRIV